MSSNAKLVRQMEPEKSEQGHPMGAFGGRMLGTAPAALSDYTQVCPDCGARLGETEDSGYGFAYGGGLGQYMSCPNDDCNWFVKWLDPLEQEAN